MVKINKQFPFNKFYGLLYSGLIALDNKHDKNLYNLDENTINEETTTEWQVPDVIISYG